MALVLFILYREAFTVLPLHMDTGYYVPNRAILTRRLAPFDGWNVHFSGASRALPQLVHTALYLAFGSAGYARAFRLLYSLLCFVSGLFVYILAVELGGQGWQPTYAMGLYWVLTSESQYGTYFESAEAFQTVIELGGLILLIGGLQADLPWMTGLGLALFWIDTVFVKISAAASAGSLSLATLYLRPDLWLTTFALGAAAVAAYSLWLRACGVTLRNTLHYLASHERYCRRDYPSPVLLFLVKIGFIGMLAVRNPFIPALSAIGLFHALGSFNLHPAALVCGAYALGWAVIYFKQGNRVHYYLLPILPLVAFIASLALFPLGARFGSSTAHATLLAAIALSIATNLWQRVGRPLADFNRRVWRAKKGEAVGDRLAEGNLQVAEAVRQLGPHLRGRDLLVLGPYNQASLLFDAAYDTPLTSLCALSEGVAGDIRPWLPAIDRAPPAFLLDTDQQYEHYRDRLPILCGYELVARAGRVRLYRLEAR